MKQELLPISDLQRDFERQLHGLWPVLKGSLAKIRKPCIRANCKLCASGTKHPAWILSVSQAGRRRCLYVPEELVPLIQKAIRNERKLEQLLGRMGPALITAYRRQRDAGQKRQRSKC